MHSHYTFMIPRSISILFLQIRKLRDLQEKGSYSSHPSGFTAWLHHFLSLTLSRADILPLIWYCLSWCHYILHTGQPQTSCDIGTEMSSVPSVIPYPALFPPFNAPISPRFPRAPSCPGFPQRGGKCYSPPWDNSYGKMDLTQARHDAGCSGQIWTGSWPLQRTTQHSQGKQEGCHYPITRKQVEQAVFKNIHKLSRHTICMSYNSPIWSG